MPLHLDLDRARVVALEHQILELERTLSSLQAEKVSVQERLDSYKYPVLTLPNELVTEIFIHFLPAYPSPPPFEGRLSPTLLTQICRRWRQIALSTPDLWRAISYSGKDAPELARVHLWLSRSKDCPLLIKATEEDSAPDVSEALTAFFDHLNRWEQADLEIRPAHLSTTEGSLPLLRHLRLSLYETPVSSIVTFSDAPMLRTASLNFWAAINVVLPWAQLTSLMLSWVLPEEWVPLLQQTVNLVHCSLEVAQGGMNDRPADIRLLCLESLAFTVQDGVNSCLETFVVPALHRLEVPESFLKPNPIETLSSFISKSACKLRKIRITGERKVPMDSYRQAFPLIPDFYFEREDPADDSDSEALCSDSYS